LRKEPTKTTPQKRRELERGTLLLSGRSDATESRISTSAKVERRSDPQTLVQKEITTKTPQKNPELERFMFQVSHLKSGGM
jgi:hypothetical protein